MTALDLIFENFSTVPSYEKNKCYFKRPFYESQIGTSEKLENGKRLLKLNAIGINEDDITVEVGETEYYNRQTLNVSGKTDDWEIHYSFVLKPFKNVEYWTKNGLLFIEIEDRKPISPDVEIRKRG